MAGKDKVNILLVDDQPAKLMSYEVILEPLDETLLKANSATEAFRLLLKHEIAVILVDVSMPEMDGFELAMMIREHPRFSETAIIFISAIHLSEMDSLKGYELGAVDYMSVPVTPELLRAKVRVFVDLFRKTRELEAMNNELEERVRERTVEVETAIERVTLLAREVDHRAKNSLAVIESILNLTRADDLAHYVAAVRGRIHALAAAHNLLSESRWEGADLKRLVEEETAAYAFAGRITVDGDSLNLKPTAAQSIAVAVHELATNAAKYGALSSATGRLNVAWRIEDGALQFRWREEGGPPPAAERKEGFGMRVLSASIRSQLAGAIEFDWGEKGFSCRITLPAVHLAPIRVLPMAAADPRRSGGAGAIAGKRILLVEDEALIGMMLADRLIEEGAKVVGPFSKLEEVAPGLSHAIDAAVLDVNLDGTPVYALADELVARGVPIVFVTGYEANAIEPRFKHCAALPKPVDPAQLRGALAAAIEARESRETRNDARAAS